MRKLRLFAVVALATVAMFMLPGAALAATHKVPTYIRGMNTEYQITKTQSYASGIMVSGRLIYRATIKVNGHNKRVDATQNGFIRLYRSDFSSFFGAYMPGYAWQAIAGTHTVDGMFSFPIRHGGMYRVQFGGTYNRGMATRMIYVIDNGLSVDNLHAVSASVDASGKVFVTLSADITAPAGTVTSATPATFMMLATNFDSSIFMPVATKVSASPSSSLVPTLNALVYQSISEPGTYKFGFTVPSDSVDQTITAEAMVTGQYFGSSEATTSFNPMNLIP